VAFYNKRGTAAQWIKEGRGAMVGQPMASAALEAALEIRCHGGPKRQTIALAEPEIREYGLKESKAS
jgi:hypothetical protein